MRNQDEFFVKMKELLQLLHHASRHILFVCNNVSSSRIACVVFFASLRQSLIIQLQTSELSSPCVLDAILSSENCHVVPYRLCCLFCQLEAVSDNPITNFRTVFSMCSRCHPLIGKLSLTNKRHIS